MSATPPSTLPTETPEPARRISVVEERVDVRAERIVTGEVSLRKRVSVEEQTLPLERRDSGYDVVRRPVNETFDRPPAASRREGDATVYSVVREVPTVVMRYELVEEIVVTPTASTSAQPTVVPVRTERVDVERVDGSDPLDRL